MATSTATGKTERILPGHREHSSTTALAFTGDSKTLFSTGRGDRLIRQWDVKAGSTDAADFALTSP